MASGRSRPTTIAAYIATAPAESRAQLREMLACLRTAAPGTKEGLKWGMPSLSYGRILVMFAGYRHHIGFYPTSSPIRAFKKDLSRYKTARGSIQFPLEEPLPRALIRKITKFRARECKEQDRKWKS
jgi:uncharacterized protein YdhG (YjbR/CyaY superfamily)